VLLVRDLDEQCRMLGEDGAAWRRILEPLSRHWWALADDILEPLSPLPRHPLLLARMGAWGALPATALGRLAFRGVRARSLMAGLASHSFLRPSHPFSASFGLVMAATAHAVGWPIPRGG
jgi:phytoene dehydrogenase-like protein